MLGEIRAKGVYAHIRDEVKAGKGFQERGDNYHGIRSMSAAFGNRVKVSPNQAILRLEHEVTYLRQEMEFIKKIFYWTARRSGNDDERQA